jgi:hypothetical protein
MQNGIEAATAHTAERWQILYIGLYSLSKNLNY